MERKIQKEREMEGGEFADKEAFVTSAYKKKLQERAEEEERERREAALEGETNTEAAEFHLEVWPCNYRQYCHPVFLWALVRFKYQRGADGRYWIGSHFPSVILPCTGYWRNTGSSSICVLGF